jgi:hypothetical protein
MKILRLTCCLFVLLLSLVAFTFSPSAQASGPQSGGGGGGGNCMVSGVTVCSITVVSGRLILARTTVLISATVTCTTPTGFTFEFANGNVGITQVSHQQIIKGSSSFILTTCDGTAQTLQVAVAPFSGPPFHGGPANATGSLAPVCFFDASGMQQCTSLNTTQVIHITG